MLPLKTCLGPARVPAHGSEENPGISVRIVVVLRCCLEPVGWLSPASLLDDHAAFNGTAGELPVRHAVFGWLVQPSSIVSDTVIVPFP